MSDTNAARCSKFLTLPNELIVHILGCLSGDPPSISNLIDQPKTTWTAQAEHPLKNASVVSHRLRSLTLPLLFRHTRLDPYHLSLFLDFIRRSQLTNHVESVVAHLQGPCNHIHPAWWCRLLNEVPARRFAIGCAPHIFAEIAGISMNMNDTWAFNVPYQFLELVQLPDDTRRHIPYNDMPTIFTARPWHSLRVNEGSSLAAYTSYEYFLKRPPSLIANLQSQLVSFASAAQIIPLTIPDGPPHPAQIFLESLKEFSFVAIFPFYNHVDDILKCIRRMTSLRTLFMKLCPEPESTILEDEIKAASYHIDLNDPWSEFNTSYRLVGHTVRSMGVEAQLQCFIVDDYKMAGVWDSVKSALSDTLANLWIYSEHGKWIKQAPPHTATAASDIST